MYRKEMPAGLVAAGIFLYLIPAHFPLQFVYASEGSGAYGQETVISLQPGPFLDGF